MKSVIPVMEKLFLKRKVYSFQV